jgi:hypothetical protein
VRKRSPVLFAVACAAAPVGRPVEVALGSVLSGLEVWLVRGSTAPVVDAHSGFQHPIHVV